MSRPKAQPSQLRTMAVRLLEDCPAPCALGRVSALESPVHRSTGPHRLLPACNMQRMYSACCACMPLTLRTQVLGLVGICSCLLISVLVGRLVTKRSSTRAQLFVRQYGCPPQLKLPPECKWHVFLSHTCAAPRPSPEPHGTVLYEPTPGTTAGGPTGRTNVPRSRPA